VTNAVTRRYQDPFGNFRGLTPGGWVDTAHGYRGGPVDIATALTYLVARACEPSLGRFLSVDPVLRSLDPQQNNGNACAWNELAPTRI
jgi:RHS repeat-associated protein